MRRQLLIVVSIFLAKWSSSSSQFQDRKANEELDIAPGCRGGLDSAKWQFARTSFWNFRSAHFAGNTTEWKGSEDIRSHMQELFTFTLFFCPRSIVELGVREGWSTRAFAAAANVTGSRMVGVDLSSYCDDTYAQVCPVCTASNPRPRSEI
jgi:hypothetical protein